VRTGVGAQARPSIRFLLIVVAAALPLVLLAPWLYECTGPLRFVDCARWEQSSFPNVLAPWLICPLRTCDYHLSVPDQVARLLGVSLLLGTAGFLASRYVSRRRVLVAFGAAISILIVAEVAVGVLYHRYGD